MKRRGGSNTAPAGEATPFAAREEGGRFRMRRFKYYPVANIGLTIGF